MLSTASLSATEVSFCFWWKSEEIGEKKSVMRIDCLPLPLLADISTAFPLPSTTTIKMLSDFHQNTAFLQVFREILENEISVHGNFPDQLAGTSIPGEKCLKQNIIEACKNTSKQVQ